MPFDMSENAVFVENVSKRFLLGHKAAGRGKYRYTALRDIIAREVRDFARKAADLARGRQIVQGDEIEEFWALQNVTFEVKHGEVVAIIGRNGAGKSTMLKILSRITEPTRGRVILRGRVASLLEVGTGFHPELTGRENIFLNGAILGMTQREVRAKFDEIVAFAEVEKFLDTPVKRYSSGMYVRLAFAVAAHLDPEILVVDEILAVGDSRFQEKCIGRMQDIASGGRTVIMVSHNLAIVSQMASRAILLDAGTIAAQGSVDDVIATYLSKSSKQGSYVCDLHDSDTPHVKRVEILTSEANGVQRFGKPLEIRFRICHRKPMSEACFSFQIVNQYQQPVIHAFALPPTVQFGRSSGETLLVCRFPALRLNVGQFYLRTFLSEPPGSEVYETLDGICQMEVVRTDYGIAWEWRPDTCAYHEEWQFEAVSGGPPRE
jgi:ABC-type polysaccharide/polyol phosphate transport system ATPase subunit